MLQLKLNAPSDQVFIGLTLENPLTGNRCTIDAKVDTGAAVTFISRKLVEGLELETLGHTTLILADGRPLQAEVQMCRISFSDEDEFETPIYVNESDTDIVLLGMDVLKLCNFSQTHIWEGSEHYVLFQIELLGEDAML